MTIGLQQMGAISDSVMARSQTPLSGDGEGQAAAVERDGDVAVPRMRDERERLRDAAGGYGHIERIAP